MKIKRIQIKNIGPYINENAFQFDVSNLTKRLALIGGKNGAGKTTLFNAIKICLYGCVAYGFESNNARYYAEVEKLINTNEKLKKIGEAEVVIDLLFDDGKDNFTYTFARSWRVAGKKISESFTVYKNGVALSSSERSDFESYLLQMLPPNLFRFYFFDGEKISDFVFNSNKNSDFKEAFLKLCSLDTMEIIRENFRRISRNKANGSEDLSKEYDVCLEADNLIAQRVECAEDEYKDVSNEILLVEQKLAALEKTYAKSGGISKKEWRSMQDQITKEEIRREANRKWLKDVANNVLPFIILNRQLEKLRNQIAIEHKAQIDANVKSTIDTPEIQAIIAEVLNQSGTSSADQLSKDIIDAIANYTGRTSHVQQILNLSDFDRFELTSKINSLLAFDVGSIQATTNDIEASLSCVKRIRKKMERSSIENYDAYLIEKSNLNEQKSKLAQRLLEIEKELQLLREQKAVSAAKLSRARSNYETLLKKQSINDISARALLAFNELQRTLYEKSIRMVEEGFQECFSSLINKSDLIDGIHIDSNLNVLPYKNKAFKADEIRKIIGKNGVEYLIAQIGLYAYEVLQEKLMAGQAEFELPVEVKQQLSAGEKQIFIMALYQGLSRLNKINVPYIVDTPFARIDKEHRSNILTQFFTKLNGQILILSTDEEIVGAYQDMVSNITSDTYVLKHASDGSTQILANTYFGRPEQNDQ
jgi:DNA sulfur modification protein DndD